MIDKPHRPLELNAEEVLFLTDAVQNGDVAAGLPEKEAYVPLGRETLLLLGGAYVELVGVDALAAGTVTLSVEEETVWLLRSKVQSTTTGHDQRTNIGVALLRKLYRLLLAFHAEVDIEVGEVDEPILPLEEVQRRMAEFKRETSWAPFLDAEDVKDAEP